MLKKIKFARLAAFTAAAVAGSSAMATGTDFTSLTSSVDFSTVITALLAIGALIAALFGAMAGIKHVLRMIRGA